MGQYTKEELQKFREDIDHYYQMRKMFAGLGWACMGTAIILFFVAVGLGVRGIDYSGLVYLISFLIPGAIVLWILRSALYNARINNRKRILQQEKEEHEINQMFENKQE